MVVRVVLVIVISTAVRDALLDFMEQDVYKHVIAQLEIVTQLQEDVIMEVHKIAMVSHKALTGCEC